MRAAVTAILALAVVGGCTRVTRVAGPNGEAARLISCSSTKDCYTAASEECPYGYVILSSGADTYQGTSRANVLVSCKSGREGGETKSEAVRHCDAIFGAAWDFEPYWLHQAGSSAVALDELPVRRDFRAICAGIPEYVRHCMFEPYRLAHGQNCDAVFARIDGDTRGRIDSLYLAAPERRNDGGDAGPKE